MGQLGPVGVRRYHLPCDFDIHSINGRVENECQIYYDDKDFSFMRENKWITRPTGNLQPIVAFYIHRVTPHNNPFIHYEKVTCIDTQNNGYDFFILTVDNDSQIGENAPSNIILWLSFSNIPLFRELQKKGFVDTDPSFEIRFTGCPRPKPGEVYDFFMKQEN